jgi:alkanesulfonate monooxygenase SsuD/methylene tetrahydromethanopterin reductase-like flavin-dependent oxidoreductase (luciferase family)
MTLHIGYGLIAAQRIPGSPQSWADVYADALAVAEAVDEAGFDTLWVTEHHFTDDGYLSALFPMLSAMAVRTSRVVLGTNVALAPLYQPLRLAEDAAAVATIANGRFLLGLGIGYRDEEFAALGVQKRERVPRLVEAIEVCRAAWTGEPFSYNGPTVHVEGLTVRPAPPGPPQIWTGGWVDAAVRRADRLADGYISPVGGLSDTRRRVGMLAPGTGIATTTFVCVTPDGSLPDVMSPALAHVFDRYAQWYGSSSDQEGGRSVADMIRAGAGGSEPTAGIVLGNPATVAAALEPLASAFASDREHHLVVRMHQPGVPRAELIRQLRLFATDVIPQLRAAAGSAA